MSGATLLCTAVILLTLNQAGDAIIPLLPKADIGSYLISLNCFQVT